MRKKPKMIYGECKRGCGTELASLARSLHGADSVREKYAFICKNCLTEEEIQELQNALSAHLLKQYKPVE